MKPIKKARDSNPRWKKSYLTVQISWVSILIRLLTLHILYTLYIFGNLWILEHSYRNSDLQTPVKKKEKKALKNLSLQF